MLSLVIVCVKCILESVPNFIRIRDNIIFLINTDVSEEGGTGSCDSPDEWQRQLHRMSHLIIIISRLLSVHYLRGINIVSDECHHPTQQVIR